MYFMGFLGFGSVPVAGSAMAENIQDLDIMLAFDESGSMEFFTLCYGCWTPSNDDDGVIFVISWIVMLSYTLDNHADRDIGRHIWPLLERGSR